MNNYRINIYFNGQHEQTNDIGDIDPHCEIRILAQRIKKFIKTQGIQYVWWFYEPYLEITWLDDNKTGRSKIIYKNITEKFLNIGPVSKVEFKTPADGKFGEWFCKSEHEREFGAKRYAVCSDLVDLFYEYSTLLGKGKDAQVARSVHALCNPLGINYKRESKLCFSRGLICWLFTKFKFKRAVWIYRKIFRQKY